MREEWWKRRGPRKKVGRCSRDGWPAGTHDVANKSLGEESSGAAADPAEGTAPGWSASGGWRGEMLSQIVR